MEADHPGNGVLIARLSTPSAFQKGESRGVPSRHLPPTAFIDFLQNHDQIGNRAFGERISDLTSPERLALGRAGLLLSPQIPMPNKRYANGEQMITLTITPICTAGTWRLDDIKISYMATFASNWGLLVGSLVIALPVILWKVEDSVSLEKDIAFTDETIEEVAPKAIVAPTKDHTDEKA